MAVECLLEDVCLSTWRRVKESPSLPLLVFNWPELTIVNILKCRIFGWRLLLLSSYIHWIGFSSNATELKKKKTVFHSTKGKTQ